MALIRLLERNPNGEIVFREPTSGDVPAYAILSHTWGQEEVLFQDMEANADRSKTVSKAGWRKLWFCANQAAAEGLRYFWVDTCCIDKSNHIELQKAINSMFRWYKNAEKCYVYLPDVSITEHKAGALAFRQSRWFRRGWTLQELLAPASVEFFSQEWKTLGDKQSLTQQIHEATGIPHTALQGAPMFQFSDKERFSWIQSRETKVKEDKAYSLLGIFDVEMPLRYGEGSASAFKRLEEEISKLNGCLQDLRSTDPRDDKRRIEETKGGLLEDSYCWILENSDFRRWRDDPQSRLLWIEGDPGKGKTMLLCGIVKNLKKAKTAHLSYFFCQATDSRINNATAVLRGLLYLLVTQQPSLVSHIQKKYDYAGKALFEDANAWVALSEIFINILQDSSLNSTYLIVDALDECVIDLPKLLDFIVRISSIRSCAKWIVSSRSEAHIEQRLQLNDSGIIRLSLDLKENAAQVSRAVDTYINCCLLKLPEIEHDIHLQDSIREKMQQKANGTFLWVSLAMRELKEAMAWEVLQVLEEVPIELKDLYRRMIQQIKQLRRKYPELCRQVLSTVLATYRPLHLQELYVLSGLPTQVQDVNQATAAIVKMCGSFLTIREDIVYIIHQSARDFLSEASHDLVPSGIGNVHQCIFTRSLQVMSRTLRRDMYSLCAPGYSAKRIKTPDPDPLAASRYPCIYWIDHLCDWNPSPSTDNEVDLQEGGAVESFLKQRYLYWLEALSLCKNMSKGVVSMAKLEIFMQKRTDAPTLNMLVRDAQRFIMSHKSAIEKFPLQAYASALLFSPTQSLIRRAFNKEEPNWIVIEPAMEDNWSPCLSTLEGHNDAVWSVAFSHNSAWLASASDDNTVKIWDPHSGECLLTLKGHRGAVRSVTFSHDSARLASASGDETVKIWDPHSGKCLLTLKGHWGPVRSVTFSHDSARLASASVNDGVKIWDPYSGECLLTFKGICDAVRSVTFSHDSAWLASASYDCKVKIWDPSSGDCLLTLNGHYGAVRSVAFSHDSAWLASASYDNTVNIWDPHSGECLLTLKGHHGAVSSIAFSHDSAWLASAASGTVKIWDPHSGECLSTLKGHRGAVLSITFSHDSARLASAAYDDTVKIWDPHSGEYLSTLKGHRGSVSSVTFSHDSARLASASVDHTVKIWDPHSGEYLATLKGHRSAVSSIAFSHDSTRLASASAVERTVETWDLHSGKCLLTLKGHRGAVSSVTFSHDSALLASASDDETVKIWDPHIGKCLLTLKGHYNWVSSVAFSHDSAWLASASVDSTVKIWDPHSGECLSTFWEHHGVVSSVAFSHDSAWLASAASDVGTVKIWDPHSGECLSTISIGMLLQHISFSNSGPYLHTDIGTIDVSALSSSDTLQIISVPCSPHFQGLALRVDSVWITYNSEKLVWLPSEYRPSCSAVSTDIISIGVGTGMVWVCKVKDIYPKL